MKGLLVFFMACVWSMVYSISPPGVQIRITDSGMKYIVDVGIDILKKDLLENTINEKGSSGRVEYDIINMKVTKAEFGSYNLSPVPGSGMRGIVKDISIEASGKLYYKYKRGWFKFQDTIGIDVTVKNVAADLSVTVGMNQDGRPTVDLRTCNANVDDIELHFRGGGAWAYNLVSGIIESKLKKTFGKMVCGLVGKAIDVKAKKELETFPVIKNIGWAKIDYSLTKTPVFTADYMDAYLKGRFISLHNNSTSILKIPQLKSASDHSKMVYFWITDYTINSAGEVAHKEGVLSTSVAAWDPKMPSIVKNLLKASAFEMFIPGLKKYGDAEMAVDIQSYKPPVVLISASQLKIQLYANTTFKIKDKDSKLINAFSVHFDITASAVVLVKQDNIGAKIATFDYNAKVDRSWVGKISIPLDSPLLKAIIDMGVIKKANPILVKGFPLPKVDDVALQNVEIKLIKDAIRVGTDLCYLKDEAAKVKCQSPQQQRFNNIQARLNHHV